MTPARAVAWIVGLTFAAGCASSASKRPIQSVRENQPAVPESLVVLLRDDDGSVGRAVVSNEHGSTDLTTAGGLTTASATAPPAVEHTMAESDIQTLFGAALAALPPPPERFTVHFQFESNALTPEGGRSLTDIVAAVRRHLPAEVTVVGHADSAGPSRPNFELGLRRAERIRDLLVAAGVDASCIDVSSRGESDPAVRPGDQIFERRNRRVDITVR